MSYSRRQLEAFGEPLGDSATRVEAGRRIYGSGGGGGGSATGTQTQITDLPEWARGYAKSTMEKTQALTDKPYQAYGGNRIAGFDPMQLQAQQDAAKMGTSQYSTQAGGIAGDIASRAQGANYAPGQFNAQQVGTQSFTQPGAADQYMSPYMQSVVDIQKREAGRQSAVQGTQQQAQATQAGAFGGSRDAIMRAERERNLGQQMGDIQATGSQAAFQQAQQQFNAEQQARLQAQMANQQMGMTAQQAGEQSRQYGAGYGLQGLQTGLTAAGQLGQLGYQTTQQGMDINRLQSAYGGQRQALRQQGLSQGYEDWQNQQQYPYKQLGFMSDMIRGLPVGSQSTSITQAPGASAASQLGGLGAVGMGLSKYFAKGGAVKPAGLTALALARMRR